MDKTRPSVSFSLIYVTARAVPLMQVLSELTIPFLKVGGQLIALKAAAADEELADAKNALNSLLPSLFSTRTTDCQMGMDVMSLLSIRKKETPNKYPRRAGIPNKKPITFIQGRCLTLLGLLFTLMITRRFSLINRLSVTQKLVLSFVFVIIVGSILLSLPIATMLIVQKTSYLDHLFNTVSMVCVTGLSVVPVSKAYNGLGQIFSMLLMQTGGGLGLVSYSL